MAAVTKVAADYSDHVTAVVVYIIEAHAKDGWKVEHDNEDNGISVSYAKTIEEKAEVAERLRTTLCDNTAMKQILVDGVDNKFELAYEARPERLFVLDSSTLKINWKSGPGPFMYSENGLRTYLKSKYKWLINLIV